MRAIKPLLFIILCGCSQQAADGPVLLVTAAYPGADAQTVANTVAAPIEQQINGVELLVRIESESKSDGSYTASVRFKANADPTMAATLVQNRVNLALPMLPELVQRSGVTVKVKPVQKEDNRVAIALVDQGQLGQAEMRKFADVVLKRITEKEALANPEIFPGPDADQLNVQLDRAKCAAHGVAAADVTKVIEDIITPMKAAKLDEQFAALMKARLKTANGGEVALTELANIKVVPGPNIVFRVNLHSAIRISGSAPNAKAAANCAALAEAERKRLGHENIKVVDLTAP